jgi:hypothetical protein
VGEPTPVAQGVGGELGPVIAANERRCGATIGHDRVERVDGGVGVDRVGDHIREGLAGELVDDVEDLDCAASGGGVELVVERSHMIGPPGVEPVSRGGRDSEPLTLAALHRHP